MASSIVDPNGGFVFDNRTGGYLGGGGADAGIFNGNTALGPSYGGQPGVLGAATGPTPQQLADAKTRADDTAYLNDQANQLRSLLGRTDTSLNQGLTNNEDQYNTQVGAANNAKDQQYANYADQRTAQKQTKQTNYDQINRDAGTGYNSLAQIIGRSAGTGSSAFQDLLPDVIGKDVSSKRMAANNTYGQNVQGIDKAQSQYDLSFGGVLSDLMRQKKANEESLRSGVEDQRQNINGQLSQNAGQLAQAQGGDFAAVKAAQAPYQSAIDQSRNAVDSFFNQFRTPYTPTQAVAATPDLAQYTPDRSVINANATNPGEDSTNPYSALLRRRLQGLA